MSTKSEPWFKTLIIWTGLLGLTAVIGLVDLETGIEYSLLVCYFIPVALAAWNLGGIASVVVSLFGVLVWFAADIYSGHAYASHSLAVWNTLILLCSLLSIAWAVWRARQSLVKERRVSAELRQTLARLKILEGLLPVCASCKKIRDDQGEWQPMELYLREHAQVTFTHGLCPKCAKSLLEEAGLKAEG